MMTFAAASFRHSFNNFKCPYKFANRSLYQKARIGELPHFFNEMKKCNQYAMFAISKLAVFFSRAILAAENKLSILSESTSGVRPSLTAVFTSDMINIFRASAFTISE